MAKQKTKQGDERLENVEEALSKTELWIENHQKTLWIILIALLVVALGIFGITRYKQKRNETAKNTIFPAVVNFEEQAQQQVDYAQYYMQNENYAVALNGDGQNPGFLEIVDNYGSTRAGALAAYYAGVCYLKQRDYDNAITYLKKYDNNDQVLAPLALGMIGDCYLEKGDQENAASYYQKATKKNPNEYSTPMLLTKLAMTYELMGDNAKALEAYKTLKKDYPNALEASNATKNIAYLEQIMK